MWAQFRWNTFNVCQVWCPLDDFIQPLRELSVVGKKPIKEFCVSVKYRGSLLKGQNVQNLELQMISGGKHKFQ